MINGDPFLTLYKTSANATKHQVLTCFVFNFSVGRTKILAGAGAGILGALTGNAQLQQAGGTLAVLGGATSIGAHFLGKKKK